jgi:DUF4097 and DUF4098 domain-containing protein YvlB
MNKLERYGKWIRRGLLGAVLLGVLPGSLFAGASREARRSFALTGIDTLVISYHAARVSLRETGGEDLVLIERLRNAEDAAVLTEGGMLRITGDERIWIPFSMRRLEAEIGIPRSYRGSLRVQTGSGSVHSDAAFDSGGLIEIRVSSGGMNLGRLSAREIKLGSSSGSIQAGELRGNADISLSSGSLHIGTLAGEQHRIRSSSGAVRIDGIKGSADLELSSGSLRIGTLEGENHRIHSSSGKVTVESLSGTAEFTAASGGVSVRAERLTGDLRFNLKSGSLDLNLPREPGFFLDAETSSGGITIHSREGDWTTRNRSSVLRPVGENPEHTLYIRVNSGHITINRE